MQFSYVALGIFLSIFVKYMYNTKYSGKVRYEYVTSKRKKISKPKKTLLKTLFGEAITYVSKNRIQNIFNVRLSLAVGVVL